MLYEVITHQERLVYVFDRVFLFADHGGQRLEPHRRTPAIGQQLELHVVVITSYSIHYTKLYESLRNSARKAIALNADLILAFGTSAALAAKAETFETPILFADAVDPEAIGLVTQNKHDSQLP